MIYETYKLSICDLFQVNFLVRYVEAITEHKMADVPLVFITYALSKIPPQPVVASKFPCYRQVVDYKSFSQMYY